MRTPATAADHAGSTPLGDDRIGGDEHIGREVDHEIEGLARPPRQGPRDLEPARQRPVGGIDDEREPEPGEHRGPLPRRRGHQGEQRAGRSRGGQHMNGKPSDRPTVELAQRTPQLSLHPSLAPFVACVLPAGRHGQNPGAESRRSAAGADAGPVVEVTRAEESMTDARAVSQGCAVIGGGPAGLIAALALAHFGVPVSLVARRPATIDNRTTALLAGSVAALEALGVWEACRAHAAPLRVMRIADDTRRLWRAPEVRFEAAEIGLPAFGWNIENRAPRRRIMGPRRPRPPGSPTSMPPHDRSKSEASGVTVSSGGGRAFRGRSSWSAPTAATRSAGRRRGSRSAERSDAADRPHLHSEPLPASS